MCLILYHFEQYNMCKLLHKQQLQSDVSLLNFLSIFFYGNWPFPDKFIQNEKKYYSLWFLYTQTLFNWIYLHWKWSLPHIWKKLMHKKNTNNICLIWTLPPELEQPMMFVLLNLFLSPRTNYCFLLKMYCKNKFINTHFFVQEIYILHTCYHSLVSGSFVVLIWFYVMRSTFYLSRNSNKTSFKILSITYAK